MIFIPGNVPSLKNGRINTPKGSFYSKSVKRYLQFLGIKKFNSSKKTVVGYARKPNLFSQAVGDYFHNIEYPAIIWIHFVRDSKRRFDFHNAVQIIADLLTAHDYITDDDMDHFIPYPMGIGGNMYSINKNKPGVFIEYLRR